MQVVLQEMGVVATVDVPATMYVDPATAMAVPPLVNVAPGMDVRKGVGVVEASRRYLSCQRVRWVYLDRVGDPFRPIDGQVESFRAGRSEGEAPNSIVLA
jgi:hypothetical protein